MNFNSGVVLTPQYGRCRWMLHYSHLAVRSGKLCSNQETGLGNRGYLKVLNDNKLVLNEHEWPTSQIINDWYHSKHSYVPYSQKRFLGWDFFCNFLQQDSSSPTKGQNLLRFRNVISPIARREIIEEIIFPKKVLVLSKSKNIYMERQK